MAGLGTVKQNNGLYLSITGGYIWNRRADKDDPNYATQTYVKADKTEGIRSGARYGDLTGTIISTEFRTHPEYGQSVNVKFDAGGEIYIISIPTNNRYSQDMMKALLKSDLDKEIFIKPYDFIDKDTKKRVQGISFRQDGQKIDLRVPGSPDKEGEWFKTASKKDIRRFFEDLTDWYVGEVEEKVIPLLDKLPQEQVAPETVSQESAGDIKEIAPEKNSSLKTRPTPLSMKKVIKQYISQNYEGRELPKLSREELGEWYDLCINVEELPFKEEITQVSGEELEDQLNALMN